MLIMVYVMLLCVAVLRAPTVWRATNFATDSPLTRTHLGAHSLRVRLLLGINVDFLFNTFRSIFSVFHFIALASVLDFIAARDPFS